jgi:putative spermidine/putrescine transport system permease protein
MTDALARVEHAAVSLLVALGVALIGVPLVLTLYLSVFDEKLILFPPHAYTLDWYSQIPATFGAPIWTSLQLGITATAGSLLLGIPAGIGLARHAFRGKIFPSCHPAVQP